MATGWVPHRPEQRLSVAVDRLLDRALAQPFYATAIHDADDGARTDNQRARDVARGIKPGQLDWEIWQGQDGACLARRLELKRGRNTLSENQKTTIRRLTECNAAPVVAWTLAEMFAGLTEAGFRFLPNAATTLAHCEALLDGWDREADAVKSGAMVRKVGAPRKAKPRGGIAAWVLS